MENKALDFQYISGWAAQPNNGVWSVEPTAHATITIPELVRQTPDLEYVFQLTVDVHIPDRFGYREFSVYLGRIPVLAATVYSNRATLHFVIASEFMHANSYSVFVHFEDISSGPPKTEDGSQLLGLRLRSIAYAVREADHKRKHHLISSGKAYAQHLFPETKDANTTDITMVATVSTISKHITERTPFSLVRFSEGEGRILAYPQWLSGWEAAHQTLTYQYGPKVLEAAYRRWGLPGFNKTLSVIHDGMIQSARNADVVGLPTAVHFSPIRTTRDLQAQVGFASALLSLGTVLDLSPSQKIVDCYCNHVLQRDGSFDTLLRNLPFVGTVGHSDIGKALQSRFNIKATQHISIPAHATFLTLEGLHFPDRFYEIARTLEVPHQGAVFLVGAGYLGKLYCDLIKQRGGIAIDVGSVFDGWTGRGRAEIVVDPRMQL